MSNINQYSSVRIEDLKLLTCPYCKKGELILDIGRSLLTEQLSAEEASDPESPRGFSAILACPQNMCLREVIVSGETGFGYKETTTRHAHDAAQDRDYVSIEFSEPEVDYDSLILMPRFFCPMVQLPFIPDGMEAQIPQYLRDVLSTASRNFWADRKSCGNTLRIAIEIILTTIKIPRREKNKNGKWFALSLDARILKLKGTKFEALMPFFRAIKTLGNVGSHMMHPQEEQTRNTDVLAAIEALKVILQVIFPPAVIFDIVKRKGRDDSLSLLD